VLAGAVAIGHSDVLGGDNPGCRSRAYYAVMHASRAALATKDIESSSHQGTKRMFGLHLVKPGEVEPRFGVYLGEAKATREDADYTTEPEWSADEARAQCERATEFLERIRKYLTERGIPDRRLRPVPARPGSKKVQPHGDPDVKEPGERQTRQVGQGSSRE